MAGRSFGPSFFGGTMQNAHELASADLVLPHQRIFGHLAGDTTRHMIVRDPEIEALVRRCDGLDFSSTRIARCYMPAISFATYDSTLLQYFQCGADRRTRHIEHLRQAALGEPRSRVKIFGLRMLDDLGRELLG